MPLELKLEVFGDVQLRRQLVRISEAASDLRPVFREIRTDFYKIEVEQFDSEGGRGSGGWRPLRPATVAYKAAHKPPLDPRILHATLAMRKSLTRANAKGSRSSIKKDTFFVGTGVVSDKGFPYPAVHQRPIRSRLPRRRPVELTEEDRVRWVKRLQLFVIRGELMGPMR